MRQFRSVEMAGPKLPVTVGDETPRCSPVPSHRDVNFVTDFSRLLVYSGRRAILPSQLSCSVELSARKPKAKRPAIGLASPTQII